MNAVPELPYAYGVPSLSGVLRARPEDFLVDELLGFAPSGAGDHVLLQVRKRGMNTPDVARLIARHAKVPLRDIGYAGLKDRHAVTSQWFSLPLPGKPDPDWALLNSERFTVLAAQRHNRKLRRGALDGNRFSLIVRDLCGETTELPARIQRIVDGGVPNYFGEQRFGRDNVNRARQMLAGTLQIRDRFERGIYLSALRSHLFNTVLAQRVVDGTWCRAVAGDVMMLEGTRSFFVAETVDEAVLRRIAEHDIHPSGPLWGRGESVSRAEARHIEETALSPWSEDCAVLAREGLEMERRTLRLVLRHVEWEQDDNILHFRFDLPAGCYATVVMRELVNTDAVNLAAPL